MNKTIITMILLLTAAFTQVRAQQADRKATEGQSIRHRMFSDYDQAIAKVRASQVTAPKAKEATIASPQALKQHIFPGSNGGGILRTAPAGARKAGSKPAGELPSNLSATEAAQKAQASKAGKPEPPNLEAQGKEPSLHFEKPKATTPKN